MTDMIDGDALKTYLDEVILTFSTMDGHMDPETNGNERVKGALLALEQVRTELVHGRFTPKKRSVDDIVFVARDKVRRNDPGTSFEAATQQSPEGSRVLYRAIQILLSRGPHTDDEMMDALKAHDFPFTPSGLRTRRKELQVAGWVKDSGERRLSNAKQPSIVWELV